MKLIVELGALGVLGFQLFLNAKKDDKIFGYLSNHLKTVQESTRAYQLLAETISAMKADYLRTVRENTNAHEILADAISSLKEVILCSKEEK